MSKIDETIASARKCPLGAAIEVPLVLWSKEEIEELYARLPPDLRINPEGRTPECARIERVLPVPAIERQALAAYDASDRHIPDSDLDDEQPITLLVRTTLGEIRRIRRHHAMIEAGAQLASERERAIRDYEDSL